jgi:CDP-paratose 2-epimerase
VGRRAEAGPHVLHIDDLRDLVWTILRQWSTVRGRTLNAGGGRPNSASLREATAVCERQTGRRLRFESVPETHPSDVRIYLTDNAMITAATGWTPTRDIARLFSDSQAWMLADEARLRPILAQ